MKYRDLFEQDNQVDISEPGLIKNVVLAGPISKNGRKYKEAAYRKGAALYNGRAVHINHGGKARTAEDRFGTIEGAYHAPGNRVRGNIRYLESHPMKDRVLEDIKKGLNCYGCSHVIDGVGTKQNGTTFIEEITEVDCVDIVTGAATVKGLSEQLLREAEEPTPEGDAATAMQQGLEMQIVAVIRDANLDTAGKLAKIEAILTANEDMGGTEEAPAEGTAPAATEQLIERVMSRLLETHLGKPGSKFVKPKSGQPMPGKVTEQAIPTDPKKLAAWLRSSRD